MPRFRQAVAVPLSLMLIAMAVPAAAQAPAPASDAEAKSRAQSLLKEGTALYQIGDLPMALEKFLGAYASFPSPKLFFNIGQAHREMGHPTEAMDAFQRFLAETPDPPAQPRAEAERAIKKLEGMLAAVEIKCPTEGAEITVDGRAVGTAPLPRLVWMLPGAHTIVAKKPGNLPLAEQRRMAAGDHVVIDLVPRAAPPPVPVFEDPAAPQPPAPALVRPPAPPASVQRAPLPLSPAPSAPPKKRRVWTWIAAGAAAIVAAGAITTGLSVQSRFVELRDKCGSTSKGMKGCPESDIKDLESQRDLTNQLWVGTGLLAVTSGVLFQFEGGP